MNRRLQAERLLQKLQNGYIQRDLTQVDAYMDELFVNSDQTVIVGTSNGELCLGFDRCKKLIHDDWKGWGDVRLDIDNTWFQELGNAVWFAAPGTVKYTFKDDPEIPSRYLGFISEQLEHASESPAEALSLINWALSQAFFRRSSPERTYLWPIRLTGAVVQNGDRAQFQYMQFSVPGSVFPDTRIGTPWLDRLYAEKPFPVETPDGPMNGGIRRRVKLLADCLSSGDPAAIRQSFDEHAVPFLIDPHNRRYRGMDEVFKGIREYPKQWGRLDLDLDHMVACEHGDLIWVCCGGLTRREADPDTLYREQLEQIEVLLQSDAADDDKLFTIHRNIGAVWREAASGANPQWPCRFEAAFHRSGAEGEWLVANMHCSFPFYWILEGKIQAEMVACGEVMPGDRRD